MFSRIPGTIRETDVEGDDDPAINVLRDGSDLATDDGVAIVTESGEEILVFGGSLPTPSPSLSGLLGFGLFPNLP